MASSEISVASAHINDARYMAYIDSMGQRNPRLAAAVECERRDFWRDFLHPDNKDATARAYVAKENVFMLGYLLVGQDLEAPEPAITQLVINPESNSQLIIAERLIEYAGIQHANETAQKLIVPELQRI